MPQQSQQIHQPQTNVNILQAIAVAALSIAIAAGLRNQLVFEIQGMSLLLFQSPKPGLVLYTILMLPGTIIHELSHWLVAEILQVRTGAITIFPEWEEKEAGATEQRLGSVETVQTDPLRGFLIGLAPFITGIGILMVFATLLTRWWGNAPWWQIGLVIYGSIVIGNSMLISRADRRNWPFIAILTIVVYFVGARIGLELSETATSHLAEIITNMVKALGLTICINLATIAVCFGIRKAVEHITKRKIIRR